MAKKAYISASVRALVLSHGHCQACGTWDADECGHIVAESNGGKESAENLIQLCGFCNRTQGVASVRFKSFASYTESPAVIKTRRAYWAKYCSAARAGIAKPFDAMSF